MALHTFFFTAPEELARPPVGLEGHELPHPGDPFDEAAAAAHEAACVCAMEEVFQGCDARHRERVTMDGHVGCVFERWVHGWWETVGSQGRLVRPARPLPQQLLMSRMSACLAAPHTATRWCAALCAPSLPARLPVSCPAVSRGFARWLLRAASHTPTRVPTSLRLTASPPPLVPVYLCCSLARPRPGPGAPRLVCAGRPATRGGRCGWVGGRGGRWVGGQG